MKQATNVGGDQPKRFPRGSSVRILLAMMPKSGSTWLRLMLQSYTTMPWARLAWPVPRREQEIEFALGAGFAHGFIAQQHVRAHKQTEQVLKSLHVTPVVVVRNIFDHIVSLKDHIEKRGPDIPTAYVS